jgi:peptidoglycan/LPS O-acetylase OafA/YrhL
VQLFFAISGFLITSRLMEEHDRWGSFSLKAFYIRRGFRILPPAMTYLAVIAGLAIAGVISVPAQSLVAGAAFCRNYFGGANEWYTGHFWSLAVEEQFYLVWPALLGLSGLRRSRWVGLSFISLIIGWRWLDFHHQWGARVFADAYFWFRSDIVFDGLLWGCVCALLLRSRFMTEFLRKWLGGPGIAVVALIVVLTFGYQLPLTRTIQSMLFPAFIVGTSLNPQILLGRILEWPTVRWFGRMSYSLYIWQQAFLGLGRTSWLLFRLLAVLACAAASYYYIERPLTRLGHRLAPPTTPGHADLAAMVSAQTKIVEPVLQGGTK